jgi:hypothetical protein
MHDPIHLVTDLIVVGLATAAFVMTLRMRGLFRYGRASRALMLLAFSPVAIIVAEGSHLLEVWWPALEPTFSTVHDVLEMLFFVVLAVGSWLFVQAWRQAGGVTMETAAPSPSTSEADVLADVINRAAKELVGITGPHFGHALFYDAMGNALASCPDEAMRARVRARVEPALGPKAREPLPPSGAGDSAAGPG